MTPIKDSTVKTEIDVLEELVESARASVKYHEDSIIWCEYKADVVALDVVKASSLLLEARQAYDRFDAQPRPTTSAEPEIAQLVADKWERQHRTLKRAVRNAERFLEWVEEETRLAREAAAKVRPGLIEAQTRLTEFEQQLAKATKAAKS